MVTRILAMIGAFACLIALMATDLNNTQRFLLAGVTCFTAIATWEDR
jgi:hypothetical protein